LIPEIAKRSEGMIRGIALALSLTISLAGVTKAQEMTGKTAEAAKNEIITWENTKVQMFLTSNAAAADWLASALCDGVAYTGADGILRTKAQLLAELRSGGRRVQAMNHHDLQVHVYGVGDTPQTAIVTFIGEELVELNGKTNRWHDRATDVLIKDGNIWRVAAHQVTLIPDSEPHK
jgi:Domain of unknown function (DUF4440)